MTVTGYEREDGPRRTLEFPAVDPNTPVEFTVRATVPAWVTLGATSGTELPLFECSHCPGVVVWGDRLGAHQEAHHTARRPDGAPDARPAA